MSDERMAELYSDATETPEDFVWRIDVVQEEDGRYCADYITGDLLERGVGNYAATPIGALAELCATLIKVAEDKAHEAAAR